MSTSRTWSGVIRMLTVAALAATVLVLITGCTTSQTPRVTSGKVAPVPVAAKDASGGPGAGQQNQAAAKPKYSRWVVYINDDSSYTSSGITRSIALNFQAVNPTPSIKGKYTGTATASTKTQGSVGGAPLRAQAIAQSGQLQFTIQDPGADDQLGSLTKIKEDYWGSGTITMNAAGSATVGSASGSYKNTSSQNIILNVKGSKVTLKVIIEGHEFTFHGTISGK